MDSANKQTAVVAEVTQGTTPATPAFKVLRDIRATGTPQRAADRSPERRSDRMAANMFAGLNSYPKSIELPFARDAGSDILLASVMQNAFATNLLKNASTIQPFTLEEKYEGGATDPYRRLTGCVGDTLSVAFQPGQPGTLTFGIKALAEAMATTAIASSTYAAPTPALDPCTTNDIVVTTLFGITTPKVTAFRLDISNNIREQYKFGSADPFGLGLGLFDVRGQVELYFSQAADYSTFMTRQTGAALDITIGATANQKDQIVMNSVDVWMPDLSDPGNSGDHIVTLNFLGRFNTSDNAAIKWSRAVA